MTTATYIDELRKMHTERYVVDAEDAKERLLIAGRLFALGDKEPIQISWCEVQEYGEDTVVGARILEALWDLDNALSDYLAFAVMQAHDLVAIHDAIVELALPVQKHTLDRLNELEEKLTTLKMYEDASAITRQSVRACFGTQVPVRLKRFV